MYNSCSSDTRDDSTKDTRTFGNKRNDYGTSINWSEFDKIKTKIADSFISEQERLMGRHNILCREYVSDNAIRYYQFIPCIFAAGDKSIEVNQLYSDKRAGDLEGTDKINSTRQLIRDSTESIYIYGDYNRCTCLTSDQFSDQRTETDRDSWNCDIGEITTAKINGYATRLLPYHLKFFRLRTSFSQYNKSKEAKVILNVLSM